MTIIYTYTEARQNLATLLNRAALEGEVRIKRRDGRVFVVRPEERRRLRWISKGLTSI